MKTVIKKIIKAVLKATHFYPLFISYRRLCAKQSNDFVNQNPIKELLLGVKFLPKVRTVSARGKKTLAEKRAQIFREKCKRIRISFSPEERFVYDIDPFIFPMYFVPRENLSPIGNLTVDYAKVIKSGFANIEKEVCQRLGREKIDFHQSSFLNALMDTCERIKILRERYLKGLVKSKWRENQNIKELVDILTQVPLYPPRSFREALQSFLFINSLIWLDDHPLVGLGRLDQVFYPYLKTDLENGILTKEEVYNLLKEFFLKLHRGYRYKSNVLLGDTGQVIILGGKNMDGSDASNELTFMIMDVLRELKLPDPKIILRIHSKTPENLWNKAFKCLLSGLQYPLFSNDDVIIPALIKFDYLKEDAFNYVTSACWEPLIPGKSLDQNNILNLNFLEPLNEILEEIIEKSISIKNFNKLLDMYKGNLKMYIEREVKKLSKINFEPSPLLSLLIDDCIKHLRDISEGGAKYNNYGVLSIGLGNLINALFNIKRIVFQEREYSLEELYEDMKINFLNSEIVLENLINNGFKFCMDNKEVISLVNELVEEVSRSLGNFKNKFGGKFKFGLSSPAFISSGKDFPASLDGRKRGDPFGVNISPLPFSPPLSYTEIASLVSKINCEKAFNGGVLDLMIEKGFMEKNKKKFVLLLRTSFQMGVMQCHFNVLDYHTLIIAKKNPELFPNLIVRVWGFCAYFNDLPEEYQNLIIERAKYYESISSQNPEV